MRSVAWVGFLRRLPPLGTVGVALFAIWTAGLVGFVRAGGEFRARLPRLQDPPAAGEYNLAAARFGATVRASSFFSDWSAHHHPLYVLDGRREPDALEKWASAPGDQAPWIEVHWREPRRLERLVVRHAGAVENGAATIRRYTVRCLTDAVGTAAGAAAALAVDGNENAVAVHPLDCAGARGVRLELRPNSAGDVVRVYELEAWGR